MAQIISKHPFTPNQVLPVGTPLTIPGLTATILTGSGTLIINFSATIIETGAVANALNSILTLDDYIVPFTQRTSSLPASKVILYAFCETIKPGAGQHTIELQAWSDSPSLRLNLYEAELIIQEPGY